MCVSLSLSLSLSLIKMSLFSKHFVADHDILRYFIKCYIINKIFPVLEIALVSEIIEIKIVSFHFNTCVNPTI